MYVFDGNLIVYVCLNERAHAKEKLALALFTVENKINRN